MKCRTRRNGQPLAAAVLAPCAMLALVTLMAALMDALHARTAGAQQQFDQARCQAALETNAANTRKIGQAESAVKSSPNNLSIICPRAQTWVKLVENRMNMLDAIEQACKDGPGATPQAMEYLRNSMKEAVEGAQTARNWYNEKC